MTSLNFSATILQQFDNIGIMAGCGWGSNPSPDLVSALAQWLGLRQNLALIFARLPYFKSKSTSKLSPQFQTNVVQTRILELLTTTKKPYKRTWTLWVFPWRIQISNTVTLGEEGIKTALGHFREGRQLRYWPKDFPEMDLQPEHRVETKRTRRVCSQMKRRSFSSSKFGARQNMLTIATRLAFAA